MINVCFQNSEKQLNILEEVAKALEQEEEDHQELELGQEEELQEEAKQPIAVPDEQEDGCTMEEQVDHEWALCCLCPCPCPCL